MSLHCMTGLKMLSVVTLYYADYGWKEIAQYLKFIIRYFQVS